MRRSLSLAAFLLAAGLAGEAAAAGLCERLWIPEELELDCRPMAGGAGGEAVDVVPPGVSAPLLSRMTVRELERKGEDALAWEDPSAWLTRQMTVDTSQFAGSIRSYLDDPDSPIGGEPSRGAVTSLLDGLSTLGRLALAGCEDPAQRAARGYWEMECSFTAGGLGVFTELRLQAEGERRYAVSMRTMNEKRLRHFQAIAGSLAAQR
ncbi:hypothetical protein [Marinimicrococcus flavescens]|uniref:DUF1311 domain-containing protein n=1 Tax=Marinimicrococcus flavescens TaxID=3031815 RepID=A0AAP3XRH0_9PROT|nr:hypothetical protein [Marinimicrococcus flavescens]